MEASHLACYTSALTLLRSSSLEFRDDINQSSILSFFFVFSFVYWRRPGECRVRTEPTERPSSWRIINACHAGGLIPDTRRLQTGNGCCG
ncbi:hypothetical protein JOB18_029942 [Solea senegalensis]|uniref:Uncharacterized protein n=1 Tax=Solea senegalensis TaxID=28829 RepID=A0AAV6Q6U8_SOLSE|nr:hypothetical protein JOB18_029942 [Solea senegalensis]